MTFHGYIIMLQMRGSTCRICEMFPPQSTTGGQLGRQGAWQIILNVIETNIDARKYKWIVIIKFSS